MPNHPLFPTGIDSTRRGVPPVRRGQVSGMALAMQPGCEEGSGLHAAFRAGNDGRRSRMCIPGRTMARQTSLLAGVLAITDFPVAAGRYLTRLIREAVRESSGLGAEGVRFLGLLRRIGCRGRPPVAGRNTGAGPPSSSCGRLPPAMPRRADILRDRGDGGGLFWKSLSGLPVGGRPPPGHSPSLRVHSRTSNFERRTLRRAWCGQRLTSPSGSR
jgi:hypothetical protein